MRLSLALAALLVTSGTSAAWVTPADRDPPVVAATGQPPRAGRPLVEARDLPTGWRGTRDRDTGVVTQLWGAYVEVPGALQDPAIAERAARAFLAQHLRLLAPGAAIADFRVAANQLDGARRTVAFHQTWRGLRVVGGQVHVVFGRGPSGDRLFVASSQAMPDVDARLPPPGPASTARARGWLAATTGRAVTVRVTGERVVLPIVRGPGDITYHVADRLDAITADTTGAPGRWDVYVAPDGTPLLRASTLRYATSTLGYDVGRRRPLGDRAPYPAARAVISVEGAAATTADDGSFTWPGTAAAAVVPGLAGALVQIVNQAGALATAQLTAQPGQPVTWSLAADAEGDAQLAAFIHAAIGKADARRLMPSLASWLDQPLAVYVNEDSTCNAYSTGDDIHFFLGDASCENTARIADIVYHELGHSLHAHALIPGAGAFDPALSEGLADFFAANLLDDQAIGGGFFLDDRPVRELDPIGDDRAWPDDRDPSPHLTGLIVGGALWDLRKALIAQLGAAQGVAVAEAVFVGVMQRAADIPGSYLAALIADDDDGDLGNGTPHTCAIEAAFGKHGLVPSGRRTTIGTPVVDGQTIAVPVTVPTGTACPPAQVTRMAMTIRTADLPAQIDLVPNGDRWVATLPALPDGTRLEYLIEATLDDGSTVLRPDNRADPLYQLFIGTPHEIWCERFDADPAWTQTGGLEWQWAVPSAQSASGDPAAAFTGTHVLGTDVNHDGRYANDATFTIASPPIDVAGYDQVRLQYRRWLTVEDATYDQATIAINGTPVWTNAAAPDGALHHVDREWRFHDLDVTAYAGAPVQISWSLASDAGFALGGWTLDDVCLVGLGKHAACGDGVVDEGEACDDGNTVPGDGCDAGCMDEGEAGCCSTGADPSGPLLLGLGVLALVLRRRPRP